MISSVFLDTVQLDNDKRFLTNIRNLALPNIVYSGVRKADFAGQNITPRDFSGYRFVTEWTVTGATIADLGTQRDEFVGILANVITENGATLKINKSNGTDVQVECVGFDIASDVQARDPQASPFRVEFQTERPYLSSQTENADLADVFSGGGMEIPTIIPLDLSSGGANELTLVNGGNAPSYPVFRFAGGLINPSLTNVTTGKTLNLNFTLPDPSSVIEVDTFLRTVIFQPSGANARQYATGDFWTIEAGTNLIRLGSVDPTGSCLVTWRESYYGV